MDQTHTKGSLPFVRQENVDLVHPPLTPAHIAGPPPPCPVPAARRIGAEWGERRPDIREGDDGRTKETNKARFMTSTKKMNQIFSGIFRFLLEGVPRIDNRDKSSSERRDQDEPDGKIRKCRTGTADDAGNFE